MQNALFTITLNGSTDHYLTAGFGNLVDVLAMLYRTEHERDKRLGHEKMLFKPLDADDYATRLLAFQAKPRADRVVTIDHDADNFEFAEWTADGIRTVSGSLGEVISAFSAVLSHERGAQPLPNEGMLAAEMERICLIKTSIAMPWIYEQGENDE